MKTIVLTNPVWKNSPPICPVAWLPAFKTEDEMRKFLSGSTIERDWKCTRCGHFHAITKSPDPSGGSSGTGRSQKHEH
jgi:hypothetical protein